MEVDLNLFLLECSGFVSQVGGLLEKAIENRV